MIWKNLRHRIKLRWAILCVIARYDVLMEPSVTLKFWKSLRFGRHCTLQTSAYVYGSRAGNLVAIGDYVVVSASCMILGEGGITIGDYTHLGPNVVMTSQYGDSSSEACTPSPVVKTAPISVGRGCWLGAGSVIMPGTVLGDRCVVGPNSVVYGEWSPGAKLAGNPARRIK